MYTDSLAVYLASLDKDALIAALADGSGLPDAFRERTVVGLPTEAVQLSTTGKTGARNIVEALDFHKAVMVCFRQYCGAHPPAVLDFGCGWGRIARTFLCVTPSTQIVGVDVRADAVSLAQALAPGISFLVIDPHPPAVSFKDASHDLVVAYSVFSHLSEAVAGAWIEEFARIVMPGGLVCLTTRPREHLVKARKSAGDTAKLSGHQKEYATMLSDFDTAIARYDDGEFVYVPTGGGGVLTPDFYGEAIVPRDYVERHWQKRFELVDWVEKFSDIGSQPIIVLRRRRD